MSKYNFKATIPGLPKMSNQLIRRHWTVATKEKNHWLELVYFHFSTRPGSPLEKATLRFGRHSTTCPDFDGLVSSFKWVCDALIKSGIIKDDNMQVIGMPRFYWERAPRGKGFITVEVTES